MDPNLTLANIRREIFVALASHSITTPKSADTESLIKISEMFKDLDEWLVQGGQAPIPWDRTNKIVKAKPVARVHFSAAWISPNPRYAVCSCCEGRCLVYPAYNAGQPSGASLCTNCLVPGHLLCRTDLVENTSSMEVAT